MGKPAVCIRKTPVLSRRGPLKTSCYDFSGRELSKLAGEYNVSDDTDELCKAGRCFGRVGDLAPYSSESSLTFSDMHRQIAFFKMYSTRAAQDTARDAVQVIITSMYSSLLLVFTSAIRYLVAED